MANFQSRSCTARTSKLSFHSATHCTFNSQSAVRRKARGHPWELMGTSCYPHPVLERVRRQTAGDFARGREGARRRKAHLKQSKTAGGRHWVDLWRVLSRPLARQTRTYSNMISFYQSDRQRILSSTTTISIPSALIPPHSRLIPPYSRPDSPLAVPVTSFHHGQPLKTIQKLNHVARLAALLLD